MEEEKRGIGVDNSEIRDLSNIFGKRFDIFFSDLCLVFGLCVVCVSVFVFGVISSEARSHPWHTDTKEGVKWRDSRDRNSAVPTLN